MIVVIKSAYSVLTSFFETEEISVLVFANTVGVSNHSIVMYLSNSINNPLLRIMISRLKYISQT